jgi:N-acetylglucosaminyldiphosphoundecaprenol N-acetyl-beta-D-mannosaminyltransferase
MMILGVKIDEVTKAGAIAKIASFLNEPAQHLVTTPNPEIVLYAYRHPEYQKILNLADLALPDGAGVVFAAKLLGAPLHERVSGSDMVPEICRIAREKHLKIALLGGKNQEKIERAATVMRGWGNTVVYAANGVPPNHWKDRPFHEKIVDELKAAEPDIVFVAFGHPKQEQWIDEYRPILPTVRLFLGCGGALDFVAGAAKRAPKWMQKLYLEWLWRLIIQPKRIKRIFNAVIVFPLTVIYGSIWKK